MRRTFRPRLAQFPVDLVATTRRRNGHRRDSAVDVDRSNPRIAVVLLADLHVVRATPCAELPRGLPTALRLGIERDKLGTLVVVLREGAERVEDRLPDMACGIIGLHGTPHLRLQRQGRAVRAPTLDRRRCSLRVAVQHAQRHQLQHSQLHVGLRSREIRTAGREGNYQTRLEPQEISEPLRQAAPYSTAVEQRWDTAGLPVVVTLVLASAGPDFSGSGANAPSR